VARRLAIVPFLVVFAVFGRQIIRGIMEGSSRPDRAFRFAHYGRAAVTGEDSASTSSASLSGPPMSLVCPSCAPLCTAASWTTRARMCASGRNDSIFDCSVSTDRHRDGTGGPDGEVTAHPFVAGAGHQGDPVARLDSVGDESSDKRRHLVRELLGRDIAPVATDLASERVVPRPVRSVVERVIGGVHTRLGDV
jgi:hypothetical protein